MRRNIMQYIGKICKNRTELKDEMHLLSADARTVEKTEDTEHMTSETSH